MYNNISNAYVSRITLDSSITQGAEISNSLNELLGESDDVVIVMSFIRSLEGRVQFLCVYPMEIFKGVLKLREDSIIQDDGRAIEKDRKLIGIYSACMDCTIGRSSNRRYVTLRIPVKRSYPDFLGYMGFEPESLDRKVILLLQGDHFDVFEKSVYDKNGYLILSGATVSPLPHHLAQT